MRSLQQPGHPGPFETYSPELQLDCCRGDAAEAAALSRYVDLTQQHHDLDYMIAALSDLVDCDELLIARLKKRKLRLKDEIARVACGVGPQASPSHSVLR